MCRHFTDDTLCPTDGPDYNATTPGTGVHPRSNNALWSCFDSDRSIRPWPLPPLSPSGAVASQRISTAASSPFPRIVWTYDFSPPLSQCVCENGAVGTSCSACTLSSQCPSNQTCLSQPASLLTHSNATLFCRSEPHGLLSSYLGEHRLELAREGDRVELLVSSSLVELQPQLLRCEYAHCEVGV